VVTRVVEVSAGRLAGWVERYRQSHPSTALSAGDGGLVLSDGAGASATLTPLVPFTGPAEASEEELLAALAAHVERPLATTLLLVRRGGYAVGVAVGSTLVHSKVGAQYVQSRTAAGGWSQQRFARRRQSQVQQLVRAAAQASAQLPREPRPILAVTGGDRPLCEDVLRQPVLRHLGQLTVARHLEVPDPRLHVLKDAAARAQAVLVTIREP
jgi:VLRF1 release factor-like protein